MAKKLSVILIMVVIIAVLAVIYLVYLKYYKKGEKEAEEEGVVVPQVETGKAVENPLEEMPGVNPYEDVVNPFTETYKNPFK